MQTADFYSSATGTLRVNGGKDENAPKGVSLSIDDLSYIKQGSRANSAEPVTDYDLLDNKPQINNITLTGNKSLNDLGIQPKIDSSHKVSADNVDDTDATNKFATAAQLAQITTNQNNISTANAELVELVDNGAKNLIPVTRDEIKAANSNLGWNGYTATNGGITFTLNEDMSITLNGTSTSTVELTLMPRSANRSMFKSAGSYELQCIVPFGSSWYVAVNRTVSGSGVAWGNDSGSGLEFTVSVSDVGAPNGIWIAIPISVQINNVTIYPMICTKAAWDISQKYAPYTPTNAELYEMIKALQS